MPHEAGEVAEAALVVLVPEIEPLVASFRQKYDPSAAQGVPAHITVNYPFVPGTHLSPELDESLHDLFAMYGPFPFRLERLSRFPDVLYLAPEPDLPFRELTELVSARFPNSPPYGGEFEEVVPHLTIAQSGDDRVLQQLEIQISCLAEGILPIDLRADEVWLLIQKSETWTRARAYKLGGGHSQ